MKTLRNKILLFLLLCCSLFAYQALSAGAVVDVSTLIEKLDLAINDLSVKELAGNTNQKFADKIREAISELRSANKALSEASESQDDDEDPRTKLVEAETAVQTAVNQLELAGTSARPETQELLKPIRTSVDSVLSSLKSKSVRAAPEPSPKLPLADVPNNDGVIATIFSYGMPVLKIATMLLVVGFLSYCAMGLSSLRRATDAYFDSVLPKSLSGVKARQDDLAKQIEAVSAANKDINQRLAEVHAEIRRTSRTLQQVSLAGNRPSNFPDSYSEPSAPPVNDAPNFPIAADELLRQMHNRSTVLKRDFQNDMLVSDPDGKGELVLIRDEQVADEIQPLFIVPRVTQFQMRQEYYNFYEKYYECANPESGSVWILDPAVVEKVVGGWELREKGRLEVR